MATELGVVVPKMLSVVFPHRCVFCYSTNVKGVIRLPGRGVGAVDVPLCWTCELAQGTWGRRQRSIGFVGAVLLVVGLLLAWWMAAHELLTRATGIAYGIGWIAALVRLIFYLNRSFKDLCVVDLGDELGFDFPSPEYAREFAAVNGIAESGIIR